MGSSAAENIVPLATPGNVNRARTQGTLSLAGRAPSAQVPQPKHEAVRLLHTAAEVEHGLMVQYLFAASSVNATGRDAHYADIRGLQTTLAELAQEQMGRLITLQNMLGLLGEAPHLGRAPSAAVDGQATLQFQLEPLSLNSLAKYVMSSMPANQKAVQSGLSPEDAQLLSVEIEPRAKAANGSTPVCGTHVIYVQLADLFADKISEDDLNLDCGPQQAKWADWAFKPHPLSVVETDLKENVYRFDQPTPERAKVAVLRALAQMSGQTDCVNVFDGDTQFDRLFRSYKSFADIEDQRGDAPVFPVAKNPSLVVARPRSAQDVSPLALIADPTSRAWARLLNLRYALLLQCLQHALVLDGPAFLGQGPEIGDRTAKGLLIDWTFKEMRRLKKIGAKLTQMPLDTSSERCAGAPYELPEPRKAADLWAAHAALLETTARLADSMRKDLPAKDACFLAHLSEDDRTSAEIATLLAFEPKPHARQSRNVDDVIQDAMQALNGEVVQGQSAAAPAALQIFSVTECPAKGQFRSVRTGIAHARAWIAKRVIDGAYGCGGEPDLS